MWNKHQNKEQQYTLLPFCRTDCFKYSLLLSTLYDWFNLDLKIRNSEAISIFKNRSLSFIHPVQTNICNIFDPKGLTFLTRLRLGLSHFNGRDFDTVCKTS